MQSETAPVSRRNERNFFTFMTIALAVAVFIGFSRTYYLAPFFPEAESFRPPETFFSIHGAVFTAWIIVLVTQAWLIRSMHVSVHRKLGLAALVVAVTIVLTGVYGALLAANRPGGFIGVPMAPEAFLLVPLLDIGLFGLFVLLAIEWRRDVQSHKRLMLLATLSICQAGFVRIPATALGEFGGPIVQLALTVIFLLALVAWDVKAQRRIHPVTLWAGIPFVLSQPLRVAVAQTEAWQKLGRLAMSLI